VRRHFGTVLDKSEQVSQWSARPLSESQLLYAANDAHVLVMMSDLIVGSDDVAPCLRNLNDIDEGHQLMRIMYSTAGGFGDEIYVFSDDEAEAEWKNWRNSSIL
jgi:hypothetical protein